MGLPVFLYPVPQRLLNDAQLAGHIGDGPRMVDDFLDRHLPKFGRKLRILPNHNNSVQ